MADKFLAIQSKQRDRSVAWSLFALVLVVYGLTMCRTIYTGDDGDFITAMATWGVPHPTGYPLFTLLGHLFLKIIPVGNPAFRVNLMTVVFGAAAVAMFYRFVALLVKERFWAATAALLFAFAPTLWQQSLSCEVYSLTCLFLATLLYLALLWFRQPQNTTLLCLLAFIYGLALTNHLTIALFLPGFLILVFCTRRTLWREGKVLVLLVTLFLLPLTLYAYLPLAARVRPPIPWGDPSTPANFVAHVTGMQYRGNMFSSTQILGTKAHHYGVYLWNEYGWWFLWLVPIAGIALWRQNRPFCLLLLYVWAANFAYAVNYHIFDIYVYYIPSYMIVAALLAVGASATMQWVYNRLRLPETRRAYYMPLVAVVALAVPLVQNAMHYGQTDKSGNFIEDDFSANVLRSAPANSLVFDGSNLSFTLWYRRFVLGERPDVIPIDWLMSRHMFVFNGWYYKHLRRMYPEIHKTYAPDVQTYAHRHMRQVIEDMQSGEFNVRMMKRAIKRGIPVLVIADDRVDDRKWGSKGLSYNEQLDRDFERVPWGVAERLYLKGQAPPAAEIVAENERMWKGFRTRGLYTGWAHADPMQSHLILRYANAGLALGAFAERARRFDVAKAAYEHTLRIYDLPVAEAGRERAEKALAATRQATRQYNERRPMAEPPHALTRLQGQTPE